MFERYHAKMLEETKKIDKQIGMPMSHEARYYFDIGYNTAANHWYGAGLVEGWNDHIKKLALLMEPLGGKDE